MTRLKSHPEEKTDRVSYKDDRTRYQYKTKVMQLNSLRAPNISINGVVLENVEEFTSVFISMDNAAGNDLKARLTKAQGAFSRVTTIWKSNKHTLKTKIRLYNSNIKSVLVYEETESPTEKCMRDLGQCSIVKEIKQRRVLWL